MRDEATTTVPEKAAQQPKLKPCIWGRCNGTQGPDGRCNRCGSKRP
jgi:hypothetical protein